MDCHHIDRSTQRLDSGVSEQLSPWGAEPGRVTRRYGRTGGDHVAVLFLSSVWTTGVHARVAHVVQALENPSGMLKRHFLKRDDVGRAEQRGDRVEYRCRAEVDVPGQDT